MSDAAEKQKLVKLLLEEEAINKRLQALDAQGRASSKDAIVQRQKKLQIDKQINKALDITEKGTKKVLKGLGGWEGKAAETNQLFIGLAGKMKLVAKEAGTGAKMQQAFKGFADGTKQNAERSLQVAQKNSKLQSSMPNLQGKSLEIAKALVESRTLEAGVLEQVSSVFNEIGSEAEAAGNAFASNGAILQESLNTAYAKEAAVKAEMFLEANKAKMSAKSLAAAEESVAQAQAGYQTLQAQADVIDYQISQREALTSAILGPFESLKSTIESFPGGAFLSKAIGLDVFEGQMNRIVAESVQAGLTGGVDAGIGKFQALTAQTKIFGMSLKSAMLPLLAVGAIVGALMLFKSMSAETEELAKNTGQSANQSEKMLQSARALQSSSANNLANTEEILGAMTALKDEFGSTANFSGETALNVANMAAAFGIAVGDAAAVQAQFEAMGQSSTEAFNSQALTANLAEAAGVAPGKVMADIAKSSKAAAKYMGGNVKALTKAAVEAARLGMELNDMVSIADGLLDIESSIEAEFEASVMLGKRINMDLARQLALQGDIEGATKEVLNQVGSIHDFNKMDVLQRKKLAQAAGMEVGQLQEALKKQEQMNNLTAEQKKRYEAASKALQGGELTGEQLVAQQEQALAAKEMAASFDKIKNTLMKALYPVIKAITGIFTDILSPVLEVIGGIFKGFMFVLSPVLLVFKGIAKVVGFLAPALKLIAGTLGVMYGIKAMIWAGDKAALGIEKAKLMFGSRQNAMETARNALKYFGLISDKQAIANKGRETLLQNQGNAAVATNNLYKNQGLLTQLKTNALNLKDKAITMAKATWEGAVNTAKSIGNALGLTGLGTATATGAVEKTSLATRIASNVQRGLANMWETAQVTILNSQWLIEQGKTAMKVAQVAWTAIQATKEKVVMAMQSKGLLKMIGQAAMKAYQSLAAIPYVGAILGAVAAAGVIALGMTFMSDGVISPKSGGSGFGDRVMYGPEGAISFNNKDTIVAGTNLQYGNDVVSRGKKGAMFAPAGALKMNDGAINASPGGAGGIEDQGPTETEIVDIKKKAFKKLVVANMIGSSPMGMLMGGLGAMAGGLGSMFGGGEDGEAEGGKPVHDATAAEKLDALAAKLDAVVTAIASGNSGGQQSGKPVQIVIGNKVIEEIASQTKVNNSYNISAGNAGEEG